MEQTEKNKVLAAFKDATPVARKVALQRMNQDKTSDEILEEFANIMEIEKPLYTSMKNSLVEHIQRHGLDAQALKYFGEFVEVDSFTKNAYQKVLARVRKAYVDNDNQIKLAKVYTFGMPAKQRAKVDIKVKQLELSLNHLEYLISKITEFLKKIDDLATTAFEMIMSGKAPDFEAWRDKMIIQDALFEENKQFLKQSLHHLEVLKHNGCKLGVNDLRLLLYHKEGCRREKLYRTVESWIIKIYDGLDTEDERRSVYKDICVFVEEVVPMAGYISPIIIQFILDRDFVSLDSRNLLFKIKPLVTRLSMTSLITTPLMDMYEKAVQNLTSGQITDSDTYVMQIMQLYNPKIISEEVNLYLSSLS